MKKIFTIFAAFAAVVFVNAQTKVINFADFHDQIGTSYVNAEATYETDEYSIALTPGTDGSGWKMLNDTVLIFGKKDAALALPVFDFPVEKFVFYGPTGASGKVTYNLFVNGEAASSEVTGAIGEHTFEVATDYQIAETKFYVQILNSNNCQVYRIDVYGSQMSTNLNNFKNSVTAKNIKNGKIVIMKNNEAFNIFGQKLL